MHDIRHAHFPLDQASVVGIFREYVTSPTVDLGFQDYEQEFATAQFLYRSLGFVPAPPVSFNPVPGTQFLALALNGNPGSPAPAGPAGG